MTPKELWERFTNEKQIDEEEYEIWSFGVDPDLLSQLVITGCKTGTSSLYILYEIENEPLPKTNDYSVIVDSNNNAVCIIQNIKVDIIPFNKVSTEHAYKEGEGNKSLKYWRKVHQTFFTESLLKINMKFTCDMKVVYEEFKVVYKL